MRICETAVHRVICVPSDWIGQIDPGSRAALDLAIRAVRDAGATVLTDLEFAPVAAVRVRCRRACSHVFAMIKTEDDMGRNVGESQ